MFAPDVPVHDPPARNAERARRLDVGEGALLERGAAKDAHAAGEVEEAQHEHGEPVAAADDADDDDRDQQARQREHEVDEPLDDHVDGAAHVAGEDPEPARRDQPR